MAGMLLAYGSRIMQSSINLMAMLIVALHCCVRAVLILAVVLGSKLSAVHCYHVCSIGLDS